MNRRVRAYFLHNIDGRRCGMIAVTSKAQVREVVRVPHDEIRTDCGPAEAQALAIAEPGTLFTASITTHNAEWTNTKRRHPAYVKTVS